MKTNQDYKNAALGCLRGNWAPAVLATIIYILLAGIAMGGRELDTISKYIPVLSFFSAASSGLRLAIQGGSFLLVFFFIGPLEIGYANAVRALYEIHDDKVTSNMFSYGFKEYIRKVATYALMFVKVFLWSLLLIVPGVVKGFGYAMTPYVLIDHPELSANEAIHESSRLMEGHKFDLFWLYLSFIGWAILAVLTLGIGFFWLEPYMQASVAAFYNDIKGVDDIIGETPEDQPQAL